jgi:hypothetical protein
MVVEFLANTFLTWFLRSFGVQLGQVILKISFHAFIAVLMHSSRNIGINSWIAENYYFLVTYW